MLIIQSAFQLSINGGRYLDYKFIRIFFTYRNLTIQRLYDNLIPRQEFDIREIVYKYLTKFGYKEYIKN